MTENAGSEVSTETKTGQAEEALAQAGAASTVKTQHINALATEIYNVMREGKKADKEKLGVAEHLLIIARKCTDRAEFTAASNRAEDIWKQKTRGLKLPRSFVQARSDIKRFYDYKIAFVAKVVNEQTNEVTETPKSYYQMSKDYRAARNVAAKESAKSLEEMKPEGLKRLEGMVALIVSKAAQVTNEETGEIRDDTFLNECALELRQMFEAWMEEHPEVKTTEGEAESLEEAA